MNKRQIFWTLQKLNSLRFVTAQKGCHVARRCYCASAAKCARITIDADRRSDNHRKQSLNDIKSSPVKIIVDAQDFKLAEADFSDEISTEKEYNIGQPTPHSHSHLFKTVHEVTPGITREEYQQRRRSLISSLKETFAGQRYDQHFIILSAANMKLMSNDIPYPFYQNPDFLYFTGMDEPDAVMLLEYSRKLDQTNFVLFVKEKDPKRELWDGALIGEDAAIDYFAANEAYSLPCLRAVLREKLLGHSEACVWSMLTEDVHSRNQQVITKTTQAEEFKQFASHNLRQHVHALRLVKSPAERRLLSAASSIAARAFASVMRSSLVTSRDADAGVRESNLHALLEYQCRLHGAKHLSFPPVVAGSSRANTLHYINNTQVARHGDLVLMDGGCVYHGYASDVTRTWPVSGKFTAPQKILYNIVLRVQMVCLEHCKIGVSLSQLHDVMLVAMGRELQGSHSEVNFIARDLSALEMKKEVTRFCPHSVGHHLGMDTHDTPSIGRNVPLQDGVVFTIEPGLYIPHDCNHVPKRFRGIGIRIEDDILMTNDGPVVLTAELPKTVADIEELLSPDHPPETP